MARKAAATKKSSSVLDSLDAEKEDIVISTYHVYHEGSFHYRLASERDDYKDKVWPTFSETWAHMKQQRQKRQLAKQEDNAMEASGFFVHKPYLSFVHPPRTLRHGQTKQGTPLCLIHNSWFWRRWQIQFCHGLDGPGVVDPRGVVDAEHGYADRRDSVRRGGGKSNGFVQGYRVRSWRLWGETGKKYHQSVNKQRREGGEDNAEKGAPLDVSTAVTLTWPSPFSSRTREYHFRYENLYFCWKGTDTARYPGFCGSFTRFNHLKLVVTVPTVDVLDNETDEKQASRPTDMLQTTEVLLATYISSPAVEKAGTLQIREHTLLWLLKTYVPVQFAILSTCPVLQDNVNGTLLTDRPSDVGNLTASQLYKCVVATAMCMIIAEHQKREWLRHVLELAAGEAGSSAG